jgi:hypothetical protein
MYMKKNKSFYCNSSKLISTIFELKLVTTLNPQLGTIEYDDRRTVTVADLPGLIEGAHYNRGMGHKFLKHISRTQVNLFVVDVNGFQLNSNFEMRSAFETVVFLNKVRQLLDCDKISIFITGLFFCNKPKRNWNCMIAIWFKNRPFWPLTRWT